MQNGARMSSTRRRRIGKTIRFPCLAIFSLFWTIALWYNIKSMRELLVEDNENTKRMKSDITKNVYQTNSFLDTEISEKTPTTKTRIFFGIKAGANDKERRNLWRESDCASYYARHNVTWKFMVGRPLTYRHDMSGHNPKALDTFWERSIAGELLEESKVYGDDIVLLPMRDQYMALPDKTFNILEYAWWNYPDIPYIGLHDVEYCVNLEMAVDMIKDFEDEDQCPKNLLGGGGGDGGGDNGKRYVDDCPPEKFHDLYAGYMYVPGTESVADGNPEPYMSGGAYFLSRHILDFILFKDRTHTVLNGYYGSVAEDVNVGKWVAYATETHGIRTAVKTQDMLVEISDMNWDNKSLAIQDTTHGSSLSSMTLPLLLPLEIPE